MELQAGDRVTRKQRQTIEEMRDHFGHLLIDEDSQPPLVGVVFDYGNWGRTNDNRHREDPRYCVIGRRGQVLVSSQVSFKSASYREWRTSLAAAQAEGKA